MLAPVSPCAGRFALAATELNARKTVPPLHRPDPPCRRRNMNHDTLDWQARRTGTSLDRPDDPRNPYERDRGRILHSAGFRRLQAKTQVLGVGEGDFHRTRLTHSMEVAQIARGLVLRLQRRQTDAPLPSMELIEAVCFGHDIGHPPYGHSGETALNYVMRDHGGFEGNGQSLRQLTRLEAGYPPHGLNLTRRALLGVLKYPVPYSRVRRTELADAADRPSEVQRDDWKPPKCYLDSEADVVDWILAPLNGADRGRFEEVTEPTAKENGEPKHKSLDCSIMEVADDVAYGVHDFEDGVALGLIPKSAFDDLRSSLDEAWAQSVGLRSFDDLRDRLYDGSASRKERIGALVNALVASTELYRKSYFSTPLLDWNARLTEPARKFLDALDSTKFDHVVKAQSTQLLEYRGRILIMEVFEALCSDPLRLLKPDFRDEFGRAADDDGRSRVVCDYVAGMTDEYATRIYERLFVPRQGTVFERL